MQMHDFVIDLHSTKNIKQTVFKLPGNDNKNFTAMKQNDLCSRK